MKRHLNGILLAGRRWLDFSCIWIHSLTKKKKMDPLGKNFLDLRMKLVLLPKYRSLMSTEMCSIDQSLFSRWVIYHLPEKIHHHGNRFVGNWLFWHAESCMEQNLRCHIFIINLAHFVKLCQLYNSILLITLPYMIWASAWDFQQFDILTSVDSTSLCSTLLSLETPNSVQSVA